MNKILIRLLPALFISIALIVSELIFENGCKHIARGLSAISYSTRDVTDSIMRNIQDFPSYLTVGLTGSVSVGGSLDVTGSIITR
ncbi:hypothetical protein ES708_04739 [subsurface metagenome]